MRRNSNIQDYVYVNLEKPKWDKVTGHDKPKGITGKAIFDMKVTSEYLFVGDGRQDYCEHFKEAYYTFFRSEEQLTVPGTTLKGAVRSIAEAISASCVSVRSRRDSRELRGYSRCDVKKGARNIRICPACRIFGTTNYRGHVSFSDALPNGNIGPEIVKIAELWRPRRLIQKRKFYRSGRYEELKDQSPEKYYRYIEAVPKGSIFTFDLFFENAQESDLSLIFHSMGIDQDFQIKVGGAKPRCFGDVSFVVREIEVTDQLIVRKVGSPEEFMNEKLAHKDLIRSERLEELTEKITSKEPCIGRPSRWN